MSGRFTPGPWFWDSAKGNEFARLCYGGGDVICPRSDPRDYGLSSDEYMEVNEADASLIAASPRLAVAIREFLYALDRGYLDCKDDSAFIDDLRAALAEATSQRITA